MYGKLTDGVFQPAPINFTTADGRTICNFNVNIQAMEEYGYKEVVSDPLPELALDEGVESIYSENPDGTIREAWEIVKVDPVIVEEPEEQEEPEEPEEPDSQE